MRKRPEDDDARLPFPTAPVSNGEWCPPPITPQQQLAAKLIAEETEKQAKRHGMTRARFLRTAAATATAFAVLNKIHGLDQSGDAAAMPLKKQHCNDLDAAHELLDREQFVMDVQQHHVDVDLYGEDFARATFCFLEFRPSDLPCPDSIGQLNYVREVFVNSKTDVGVISGLPDGIPLGPAKMAETRDLVNQLAGSERALSQAVCDPRRTSGATALSTLEHQVKELKGRALKCYTYSDGGWRLDDEKIAYPMLREAQRLGIRLVNVHKGLPAIFAPGSPETVRTIDFPKVVHDWPRLKFCAYHSGYFQSGSHPEGKDGLTEFIEVIGSIPKKLRKHVYAEIGSTFAFTFLRSPLEAADLLGKLLKALGPHNILWGTDSIWWGSPQFLIDAFNLLEIPASMQEQFGYPALTKRTKELILGLNAAKLYGVKPKAERCTLPADRLQALQLATDGPRQGRSLRWFGPQTRRGFFAMLRGQKPRVG
jgi:hypothetical protein